MASWLRGGRTSSEGLGESVSAIDRYRLTGAFCLRLLPSSTGSFLLGLEACARRTHGQRPTGWPPVMRWAGGAMHGAHFRANATETPMPLLSDAGRGQPERRARIRDGELRPAQHRSPTYVDELCPFWRCSAMKSSPSSSEATHRWHSTGSGTETPFPPEQSMATAGGRSLLVVSIGFAEERAKKYSVGARRPGAPPVLGRIRDSGPDVRGPGARPGNMSIYPICEIHGTLGSGGGKKKRLLLLVLVLLERKATLPE